MATNAGPVYGKQYIRYAETFEASVGPASDWEMGEFRVLVQDVATSGNGAATPAQVPGGPFIGVNQAYMPSAIASPQTARQLTIARSGLLLVEYATGVVLITEGTQLKVNGDGAADNAGTAVTINGTEPLIRENFSIAGRQMALVSFL
jgi:hypothetical protein